MSKEETPARKIARLEEQIALMLQSRAKETAERVVFIQRMEYALEVLKFYGDPQNYDCAGTLPLMTPVFQDQGAGARSALVYLGALLADKVPSSPRVAPEWGHKGVEGVLPDGEH